MNFHPKDYILNIKGWHTRKKIVVIHSDDWGSIRMPSLSVREKLQSCSDVRFNNAYTKYDTLASAEDLEILFESLSSVKDQFGKSAVLTANSLIANPDFEKIKENDFQTYHYEHFSKTFKRYNNEKALTLWKEGLNDGIFVPQYHGREHVNPVLWLEMLRENHSGVREAFDHGTFGLSFRNLKYDQWNLQRAWDVLAPDSEEEIKNSITDGLKMFKAYFGFKSLSAIAPNYTWSNSQEMLLKKHGVISIQGILRQRIVNGSEKPYSYKRRYTSNNKNSKHYLAYQRRNIFFEPSQGKVNDIVNKALSRMKISFQMGKPAIISSHRVNFIGGLSKNNRDKNIVMFRELLKKAIKRWPDIEFMSAADLAKEMNDD